jgi:signal transduction histidine kinase
MQPTLNQSLLLLVTFILAATLPSLALAAERNEAQMALNRTREELVRAQKFEALGQLTGGVAHDFNNLLMAIGGGVRALERQQEERAKTLATLSQALDRGTRLTKQLLSFANGGSAPVERIDTAQAVAKALVLVEQTVGETVRLERRIAPGLWPVKADAAQLELAILNLAVNARDAMPEGGVVRVEAENIVGELGKSVSIAVTDEGVGMSEDVLARAFEPFFSTKGPDRGTGLGLAQVYAFARRSGGRATIQSEQGRGATVTITLPRA